MKEAIQFLSAHYGGEWRSYSPKPNVFVSNNGRVARLGPEGIALAKLTAHGQYLTVRLEKDKTFYVHRMVCETFNGQPASAGLMCRHLDSDSQNNTPQNLAWGTAKDNAADEARNGRQLKGERMAHAKLSVAIVAEMKRLRAQSNLSFRAIAEAYGVQTMTAYNAITGKNWK